MRSSQTPVTRRVRGTAARPCSGAGSCRCPSPNYRTYTRHTLDIDRSAKMNRLGLAPFGRPQLPGGGPVRWGCWGQVEGRPVLATGGQDGTVRLWDPAAMAALGAAADRPLTARWSGAAGGRSGGRPVLATGGQDGTVRLWDPPHARTLGPPLIGHRGPVLWGCWGQVEGRPVLATGGQDGTVRLWDPAARAPLGPLPAHPAARWSGAAGGASKAARCWPPAARTAR